MTADAEGNLHAVWGSWTASETAVRLDVIDTVYYTWWDGTTWSEPVDILVGPGRGTESVLAIGDLVVNKFGDLAIVWRTGSGLYFSTAMVADATSAQKWQTTLIDTGRIGWPALAVDPITGIWYAAYTVDDKDVVARSSQDGGATWSDAHLLWTARDTSSAPSNVQIHAWDGTMLHLVWTENAEARQWMGEAIWYASVDIPRTDGDIETVRIREVARSTKPEDPTLDSPTLAMGGDGVMHIFWNNGVASKTGRFHQFSSDMGDTWSSVSTVFANDLSGQTGRAGAVIDDTGVLHFVTSAQGLDGVTAIRYATWLDEAWSRYQTLWPLEFPGEQPSLVLTNGNLLHLLWYAQVKGGGTVEFVAMYSSRIIEAPSQAPGKFIQPSLPNESRIVQSNPVDTDHRVSDLDDKPVVSLSSAEAGFDRSVRPITFFTTNHSILISLFFSLVTVAVVMFVTLRIKSHR